MSESEKYKSLNQRDTNGWIRKIQMNELGKYKWLNQRNTNHWLREMPMTESEKCKWLKQINTNDWIRKMHMTESEKCTWLNQRNVCNRKIEWHPPMQVITESEKYNYPMAYKYINISQDIFLYLKTFFKISFAKTCTLCSSISLRSKFGSYCTVWQSSLSW